MKGNLPDDLDLAAGQGSVVDVTKMRELIQMKKLKLIGAVSLLLCELCITSFGTQKSLEGDWVGTLRLSDREDRVDLHFNAGSGTVDFPLKELMKVPLSSLSMPSAPLHFEWQEQSNTFVFDGGRSDGTISGIVKAGVVEGTLQLVRLAPIDPKVYDEYDGLYELSPGKLISITRFPPGPVYVDYQTGRTGALFPFSRDVLFSGPAFLMPAPIDLKVTFARNAQDEVTGLRWAPVGGRERLARKVKFKRQEVTFGNGDVTLSGTLVLPNTKGPYPAVIRISGAGPATRVNTADEYSAYHGTAFLSYDKRGAGTSTGDWRVAGLEALAEDALAGVRLLKSRADIDPKRIGIGAGSEGGWVAPIVASRDKDIAYITMYAGPAFSFLDEVLYEIESGLRYRGLPDREVNAALDFKKLIFGAIKSGEVLSDSGWEKIELASHKVENEKWFSYVKPWPRNDWHWKKYFLMSQYDTQPLWEKMTIPVFAAYGERDRNVPAARNAAALKAALIKAGNRDYTIIIFPKANHGFMEAVTGDLDEELPHLKRFVPGFFSTGRNWFKKDWVNRKTGNQ